MKSTTAERQRRLIELMAAHALTRGDIARILGLQPRPGGSHGTVDMWLSGARNIPASKLELIAIKAPAWHGAKRRELMGDWAGYLAG